MVCHFIALNLSIWHFYVCDVVLVCCGFGKTMILLFSAPSFIQWHCWYAIYFHLEIHMISKVHQRTCVISSMSNRLQMQIFQLLSYGEWFGRDSIASSFTHNYYNICISKYLLLVTLTLTIFAHEIIVLDDAMFEHNLWNFWLFCTQAINLLWHSKFEQAVGAIWRESWLNKTSPIYVNKPP